MPQTKPVEKPVMTREKILRLIEGIQDMHDLYLMYFGIFCGPRASEVLGLQWKSWTGTTLVPHGTAFEGCFYLGRLKNRSSEARSVCRGRFGRSPRRGTGSAPTCHPTHLMSPTFGQGERKGKAVPRRGKNFLRWRVRPIAKKLEIPESLITFQVMRRTLGTNLQHHGMLKVPYGTPASARRAMYTFNRQICRQ
jgi:integrase